MDAYNKWIPNAVASLLLSTTGPMLRNDNHINIVSGSTNQNGTIWIQCMLL